jgi:hypothetical protein
MKKPLSRAGGLLEVAKAFMLKRPAGPYYPLKLWIETSSRCNLSCRLCPNRKLPPNQRGDMEIKLFKKIIDESRGLLRDANLFHRGEPLLNERLDEMVRYAKKAGITTRLHTNATLLDRTWSERLISSGLDYISFSLDSLDPQEYEMRRYGASFEDTLGNIKGFLGMKKAMGSRTPYTVLQLMDPPAGRNRRPDSLPGPLGSLDRISLRRPHNWGGLVNERDLKKDKQRSRCTFLWYSLTILFDGRVCVCPQDFGARLVVGDVRSMGIREVFDSRGLRQIRQKDGGMLLSERLPCRDCDRIYRGTFMGVPKEYLRAFITGR